MGLSMVNFLMAFVPIVGVGLAVFNSFILPTLTLIGDFRIGLTTNTDHECQALAGLEGCEEQWIDKHGSGLIYYACTPLSVRHALNPTLELLNFSALPEKLPGYFAILDTKTEQVTRLQIESETLHEKGMVTHGFDLWVEEEKDGNRTATIFAINHRVPESRWASGADSVVEVFTTTIGSQKIKHIKTMKDKHINTPNDLVALSDHSFYVINDHAKKTGFYRSLANYKIHTELLFGWPTSTVAFCDTSDKYWPCSNAYSGLLIPAGIERGPEQSVYVSSSGLGMIFHLGIQADHSLTLLKTIDIKRLIDNMSVQEDGTILVAALPVARQLVAHNKGWARTSPSEVWKVYNASGSGDFYGGVEKVELLFSDDGERLSGVSDANVLAGKLYMAAIAGKHVTVCELKDGDLVEQEQSTGFFG